MSRRAGRAKFYFERIRNYASIPTQLTGVLASLKILGLPLWYALALIPIGYIVYLFDKKFIVRAEVQESFIISKELLDKEFDVTRKPHANP